MGDPLEPGEDVAVVSQSLWQGGLVPWLCQLFHAVGLQILYQCYLFDEHSEAGRGPWEHEAEMQLAFARGLQF